MHEADESDTEVEIQACQATHAHLGPFSRSHAQLTHAYNFSRI